MLQRDLGVWTGAAALTMNGTHGRVLNGNRAQLQRELVLGHDSGVQGQLFKEGLGVRYPWLPRTLHCRPSWGPCPVPSLTREARRGP